MHAAMRDQPLFAGVQLSSHGRGHWFDPSTAHHQETPQTPAPQGFRGFLLLCPWKPQTTKKGCFPGFTVPNLSQDSRTVSVRYLFALSTICPCPSHCLCFTNNELAKIFVDVPAALCYRVHVPARKRGLGPAPFEALVKLEQGCAGTPGIQTRGRQRASKDKLFLPGRSNYVKRRGTI